MSPSLIILLGVMYLLMIPVFYGFCRAMGDDKIPARIFGTLWILLLALAALYGVLHVVQWAVTVTRIPHWLAAQGGKVGRIINQRWPDAW